MATKKKTKKRIMFGVCRELDWYNDMLDSMSLFSDLADAEYDVA